MYADPPAPPHPGANGERPDTVVVATAGAGAGGPPPPPPPEQAHKIDRIPQAATSLIRRW
jgi:hypothetical protein